MLDEEGNVVEEEEDEDAVMIMDPPTAGAQAGEHTPTPSLQDEEEHQREEHIER